MSATLPLPNLLFCGDPHGKFAHINSIAITYEADAVVLLGDMDAPKPLSELLSPLLEHNIKVLWIPGNHDTEQVEQYDNLFESDPPKDVQSIHKQVVTIQGRAGGSISIAGLGGVFRGKIWMPARDQSAPPGPEEKTQQQYLDAMGKGNRWRGGLPLRHRSTIFADDWLDASKLKADVLVTHEAPHFYPFGFAIMHELARQMGARYSFHGHHHHTAYYGEHNGVNAYGIGEGVIMDLKGHVLTPQ